MGDASTVSMLMSGIFRWAYGFLRALSRSLTATLLPMWSGAFVLRMYSRICGAKYPPAPATTGGLNGIFGANAHMVSDSDCFSKATVRIRS